MRPTYPNTNLNGGYYAGGLVDGSQQIDSQLATSNALKNMPPPEVSVKEFTKVSNRVKAREKISKSKR
jgi:hypothetical protein